MNFEVPLVFFTYRRDKFEQIIERVRPVKPKKIYIISDYGKNEEEINDCINVRKKIESLIDWDCEIIKNYASKNRGVYRNIGEGAKWVFSLEKRAIFLEDDNLPETSFFYYCKELLDKYENEEKVLWICGTNYLGDYVEGDGSDYMFTKHLLPCGWASWSNKFLKYYDGSLQLCSKQEDIKKAFNNYYNKQLGLQYRFLWMAEYKRIKKGYLPRSWDYQMDFAIKYYDLLGVSPRVNQIVNIGVDDISEHGGNSMDNEMTSRFCSMESYSLAFPLSHPKKIQIDEVYERKIANVLLYPYRKRIKLFLSILIRKLFNIDEDIPIKEALKLS